ncbi:MAG TPA: FHA domain-containing protein [Gammaproteobacteria bacterium]|nr:FHA domain-containing protein [Gammaproteobacteria bacterium]
MASIIQLVDGVVANRFEIPAKGLKFGRISTSTVVIDDLAVSSEHAEIVLQQDEKGNAQFILRDLQSTNGSFVNEQKVQQQLLRHKDVLRIGWNNFTFINDDEVDTDMESTRQVKKSWIPGVYYSKD